MTRGDRCPGSGQEQMIAWPPDGDYPGAAVCVHCSLGVLALKRSVHPATSMAGLDGLAGTLRVHTRPTGGNQR